AGLLGFEVLADLVAQLTVLLGKVVVSVIIFGIGLYLAGVAKEVIESSGGKHADLLAKLARIAILVLAGSIALRQVGVADEIIIIAFGVLLGAIALTGVIAFGLGGRDLAAKELAEWRDKIKAKE
ncbi:MAG: mechanosensitive ion channel, partial [Bacillota bacterium]